VAGQVARGPCPVIAAKGGRRTVREAWDKILAGWPKMADFTNL
jgi:hypothetical protein